MPPSLIPSWPAELPAPESERWLLEHYTQVFTSPLSGQEQRVSLARNRWRAELFFPYLTEQEARTLTAFLARLQGARTAFLYSPAHRSQSLWNAGTGTHVVVGRGNSLSRQQPSLVINFQKYSSRHQVNAGDYFSLQNTGASQIPSALHVVAETWSGTSPTNTATIEIAPPLRFLPTINSTIAITKPYATMRLLDDRQAELLWRPGKVVGSLSLSLVEAL